MPEIELSVMIHTAHTVAVLRALLDSFAEQSGIRVRLTTLRWETAHAALNRTALYHQGPDVSEIGSTWARDLIAMNALRPFSRPEVNQISPPTEFVAALWKTGSMDTNETQWAVPWLAETYVIH